MIIGLYYLYKKEKHVEFLLPMVLVTVFETIFCLSGFPRVISNITLLKHVTTERCAVSVALANVYIYLYILSNIKEEIFNIKTSIKITLISMCLIAIMPVPSELSSNVYIYIFPAIYALFCFLLLNNEDSRYRKVFLFFTVVFTLIGGIYVNPVTKGTSIITESNLAKAIQEIVKEDENAIWISENNTMVLANYAVANGTKTINSTNIYPNEEMYKNVLTKEKFEETENIWNRYAHIKIIIDSENSVELFDKDKVAIHLTPDKIKDLNIKYIISYNDKDFFEKNGLNVESIYENKTKEPAFISELDKECDSIFIYKVLE